MIMKIIFVKNMITLQSNVPVLQQLSAFFLLLPLVLEVSASLVIADSKKVRRLLSRLNHSCKGWELVKATTVLQGQ